MDPGHNDCLEPENQKCCKGITVFSSPSHVKCVSLTRCHKQPYGNDSFNRLAGIMTVDLFHGLDCRNMDPLEQCPDDVDFGNRWNKRMEGPGVEIPQDQKYNPSCFRTAEGKDNLAANVNNASPNTLAGISSDNIGESQIVDFNFNIAALTDGENDIQDNRFADAFSSNFDRS